MSEIKLTKNIPTKLTPEQRSKTVFALRSVGLINSCTVIFKKSGVKKMEAVFVKPANSGALLIEVDNLPISLAAFDECCLDDNTQDFMTNDDFILLVTNKLS